MVKRIVGLFADDYSEQLQDGVEWAGVVLFFLGCCLAAHFTLNPGSVIKTVAYGGGFFLASGVFAGVTSWVIGLVKRVKDEDEANAVALAAANARAQSHTTAPVTAGNVVSMNQFSRNQNSQRD